MIARGRRRVLLGLLAWVAVAARTNAQVPGRRPRVGLLVAESVADQQARFDALLEGLRELGHVPGSSIDLEVRAAEGRYDRLPALARDLVQAGVEVIVAFGIKALVAAREATRTLPIVIPSTSSDPLAMGMIGNLSRPQGNVTGSLSIGSQVMAKRLELLKELAPRTVRATVLVNPANRSFGPTLQRMERSAAELRVAVASAPVRSPEEMGAAIAAAARGGNGAVVVQDDTLLGLHGARIAELALRQRLPSAGNAAFAAAGGLVGYGASDVALYRRGAYFVDRLLKGARPADLPIEQATRFELALNGRTARALGLALPEALALRADRLVE